MQCHNYISDVYNKPNHLKIGWKLSKFLLFKKYMYHYQHNVMGERADCGKMAAMCGRSRLRRSLYIYLWVKQSVRSAGERKTVPWAYQNKSQAFKIKELQKDELNGRNELNKCLCAPCYNWIVWSGLVRSVSIFSAVEKAQISRQNCLYNLRYDGPSSGGGSGLFWLSANGWSEFNFKEWLGAPQGSCGSPGNVFPSRGTTQISLEKSHIGQAFVFSLQNTQTPTSTTLYSGEHINFTCHMREANVSEWYYEFKWNDKPLVPITSTNVLRIPELTPERNGDYQCIAHHNSSEENKWSNTATVSVSGEIYRILVTAGKFPHRHVEIQDKEKYK